MIFFTTAFRRFVVTTSVVSTAVFGPLLTTIAQAVPLNGAGSTFVAPLLQLYAAQIKQQYPDISINYQGIGSGAGINQMIAGTVDFAGSDVAMKDSQAAKVTRGVVFVPVAGGPVAIIYNLQGVNNLKLSRSVLPAIFGGQITNWNDPKIAADNPGVNLPNQPIKLAVRADSSGTSYIVTNHLSAVDPYFKGRVGVSTTPNWAGSPLRGQGNPGVAQIVKQTPGTIGYVEAEYAKKNNIPTALVQNKQGTFLAPNLEDANAALKGVQFNSDYRVTFSKLGDPSTGYPISGLTWIMVYKKYDQPGKADSIKKMVQWSLTKGQTLNSQLGYTQIPQEVTSQVIQTVNSSVTGP
ncbi:MAG: phosphate ABC transporter substrate-binding protein PstS [Chroococcidiopsidaceae cyanobacterium CP_BM_ER_R8_30]|nr:phosphate ABC transporter substrate-binding protein PstS [Chroococcidiopsidaceae cyanobacterium CP_BM_ER_R8_30]